MFPGTFAQTARDRPAIVMWLDAKTRARIAFDDDCRRVHALWVLLHPGLDAVLAFGDLGHNGTGRAGELTDSQPFTVKSAGGNDPNVG